MADVAEPPANMRFLTTSLGTPAMDEGMPPSVEAINTFNASPDAAPSMRPLLARLCASSAALMGTYAAKKAANEGAEPNIAVGRAPRKSERALLVALDELFEPPLPPPSIERPACARTLAESKE